MRLNTEYSVLDKLYNFRKGVSVYSPVYGEGDVYSITDRIMVKFRSEHNNKRFDLDGKMNGCGECVLFPSKDERDWKNFPYWKAFKKGDYIKVNGCPVVFSHVNNDSYYVICGVNYKGEFCITDEEFGFGNIKNLCYPTARFMYEEEIKQFDEIINSNGYKILGTSLVELPKKTDSDKNECKFKDGDFIMDKKANYAIFKKCVDGKIYCYCYTNDCDYVYVVGDEEYIGNVDEYSLCEIGDVLAFNDILSENGYRWYNGKLINYNENPPKFDVGTLIQKNDSKNVIMFISAIDYENRKYHVCRSRNSSEMELSFDLEEQYDKFDLKFKEGDDIVLVNGSTVGTVYHIESIDGALYVMEGGCTLFVGLQDYYTVCFDEPYSESDCELVAKPVEKEFDIYSFKPFDKVLVRLLDTDVWKIGLFSHIEERENGCWYIVNDKSYRQCVPFNKFTEHLVNSVHTAPDVFKKW